VSRSHILAPIFILSIHTYISHTCTSCSVPLLRALQGNIEGAQMSYTHSLQHTATHCNTLQHTATYCNTLQHTATLTRYILHFINTYIYPTLLYTLCYLCYKYTCVSRTCTSCSVLLLRALQENIQGVPTSLYTLATIFKHTHALQHTARHYNTLQHTAPHCNTLQHTATHCNTLQHTATLTRYILHFINTCIYPTLLYTLCYLCY